LAKAAASEHRLPGWVTKLVTSAGTWAKHQAARLGTVMHAANNFESTELVDGGDLVKKVLRDSTAERPQHSSKRKRASAVPKASGRPGNPTVEAASASYDSCCKDGAADRHAPHGRRCRPKTVGAADAASTARQRKRRALCTVEQLKADAADETLVANWVATRRLEQSGGPSATERMAALRARLKDRLAS
jgi:hypothetical protein